MNQIQLSQRILGLICMLLPLFGYSQYQPQSAYQDSSGRMYYHQDIEGNRIPNFSHAGYKGGGVPIPEIATVMTLSPIAGDNTAHIQAAIDQISAMAADSNGFRGALLLDTGRYEIHGTLYISQSGVVLRGVGDQGDTSANTVLIGVGNTPNQRDILVVGGGDDTRWEGRIPNTVSFIASDSVLVGDYQVKITNPENFQVGDNVVINHPCTQEWLDAIDGGGGVSEGPWTVSSQPLIFNRTIVAKDDSMLTLDVPLYNTLASSLSPSFMYVYDREGIVGNIGVENLRIDIETAGGDDEEHAWNAMGMSQIEDSWVTGCTFLHFGLAGVYTETATRITIDSCRALDPVAQVTGARMYNFNLLRASSQVLVQNSYASNGRHHYVSNGTSSVSGCVFLHCTSDAAYNASEGHRRWSMGLLFDNLVEINVRDLGRVLLGLYNRGDYGTAHGWSLAHSVAWNCDMGGAELVCQKPPTAQNYAIGCRGQILGSGPWPGPAGYIEGTGESDILPQSLYEAQLQARMAGLEPVVIRDAGTSVQDQPLPSSWRVFPNPSAGRLEIQAPTSDQFSCTLRDLSGRAVHSYTGYGKVQLDLAHLPPACYILEISQDHLLHRVQWIKQ